MAMAHLSGNALQAWLLLLIAEHADHGYNLTARLGAFGPSGADAPSIYRALRALERSGAIGSRWAPSPNGPARRVYYLTACGEEELAAYADQLRHEQERGAQYLHRLSARSACSRGEPPSGHPVTSSRS